MNEALHTRFRPTRFRDVIGNEGEVDALRDAISKKRQQTYLLVGPSGVGKTTLARICARVLGCTDFGLTEINAAKYTGVDDMRAVEDMTLYPPLGSPVRCIIIDECHQLSPQAWQSLLKVTEEPPRHVYWLFCTTNPGKVPPTIKTRSLVVTLGPVSDSDLEKLVENVAEKAKIKLPEGVAELIAYESGGSPRQALVFLEKCDGAPDCRTAERNLQKVEQSDEIIELARFLCGRGQRRWETAHRIINSLQEKEENPEGVRKVVVAYAAKALRGSKKEDDAKYLLDILDQFSYSYEGVDQWAAIWLAVGKIVFKYSNGG